VGRSGRGVLRDEPDDPEAVDSVLSTESTWAGQPMTGTYWGDAIFWLIVLALLGQGVGHLLRVLIRRKS
jgi:hypothetical protein